MSNNFKRMSLKKKKSGFAMLFAVLVSSVLVAIGISMFSISLKELMVATSARDSEIAYYAADSAKECAKYWDIKERPFPPIDIYGTVHTDSSQSIDIICNGNATHVPLLCSNNSGIITCSGSLNLFFNFSSTTPKDPTLPSADISIAKVFDQVSLIGTTTLNVYGHNTGIPGRRVERGISFSYSQ